MVIIFVLVIVNCPVTIVATTVQAGIETNNLVLQEKQTACLTTKSSEAVRVKEPTYLMLEQWRTRH